MTRILDPAEVVELTHRQIFYPWDIHRLPRGRRGTIYQRRARVDCRSNLLARYKTEVLVIWNLSRCRSVIPGNLHLHMVLRKVATGVVNRHRVEWAGKAV